MSSNISHNKATLVMKKFYFRSKSAELMAVSSKSSMSFLGSFLFKSFYLSEIFSFSRAMIFSLRDSISFTSWVLAVVSYVLSVVSF
jgi:hypothetical protein